LAFCEMTISRIISESCISLIGSEAGIRGSKA
jgi:hypothetical protein